MGDGVRGADETQRTGSAEGRVRRTTYRMTMAIGTG